MSQDIIDSIFSSSKLKRDQGIEKLKLSIESNESNVWIFVKEHLDNIEKDSDVPWEVKHGYLMAQKCLIEQRKGESCDFDNVQKLMEISLNWLTDSEVRVRIAAGECLGELCRLRGPSVYEQCKTPVLLLVKNNLERKVDQNNKSGIEEMEQTEKLVEKLSRNNTVEASNIFHDTAGWKNLETSLSCLQRMIEGLGIKASQYIDEELLDLIFVCLDHTNRFVRETGFHVCTTFISVCSLEENTAEDAMELESDIYTEYKNPIVVYGSVISDHLSVGLADNWSQVRLAASTASRAFLMSLTEDIRKNFYSKLLPRICLNRYYLAEGVRIYSQSTWRKVASDKGRMLVEQFIAETVEYYIICTQADNHAVREASCQCIAELANKINKNVLKPYVNKLLSTLLECFKDDSWPVRDMACVAAGSFVKSFPTESKGSFSMLLDLFFVNLEDPISSVRQGAAIALANSVRAFGMEAFNIIKERVTKGLCEIKNQNVESEKYGNLDTGPAEFGIAKKIRDNDVSLHENKTMYSCGSLAPKMHKSSSGGCTDAKFRKKSEPWELADGCVHAITELSKIKEYNLDVCKMISLISEACHYKHYVMHLNFFSTVCGRLAEIGGNVDKRNFKPYLEAFFDMIFYSLESDNALAVNASEECLKSLSLLLGPNILRGRIENYNYGFLRLHDRVMQERTHFETNRKESSSGLNIGVTIPMRIPAAEHNMSIPLGGTPP